MFKSSDQIGLSRRVHLAGCTRKTNEPWMKQMARNLTDLLVGFIRDKRYLLMDKHLPR